MDCLASGRGGASGLFPALLSCRGCRCPAAARVPAGRLDRIEDVEEVEEVEEESVVAEGERKRKTPFQNGAICFLGKEGEMEEWNYGKRSDNRKDK